MDMVRRFVEIEIDEKGDPIKLNIDEAARCLKEEQIQSKNYKLFQGKKISREKEIMYEHFGKYPTIFVDFSEVQGSNFEEILDDLRETIHMAFRKHSYLRDNKFWNKRGTDKITFMKYYGSEEHKILTLKEIQSGLVFLSGILHAYYGRSVFVFFEEFDVPVNSMVYKDRMNRNDKEDAIELLQTITKKLLKGSEETVARSVSNACQQLGGILSRSANNVRLCPFLQNHSPWAIIQYVRTKEFNKYWSAGIPSEIESVIGDSKIRLKIEEMMSGKSLKQMNQNQTVLFICLSPGASVEVSIISSTTGAVQRMDPLDNLQVVIKNNIEDGQLDKKVFSSTCKEIPVQNEV
ncbi:hypothetical protein PV325_011165 [Microctonus aethiopoides]|nr:hypothetical protein PV325_011165 [Microctonus aethiopoides]